MSGAAAGKFQDHYVILGVNPNAGMEEIRGAYALLAEKYDPQNPETGSEDKLEMVSLALEVLSDPLLRKEFDKLKGLGQEQGDPKFSGRAFFEGQGREAGVRMALLCILYDRRRSHPYRPSLSNRHTEGMLDVTNDELTFALWYLKQRGFVAADDKSSLAITIDGMDYLENHWPTAEGVLPYIKAASLAIPAESPSQAGGAEAAAARGRKGARIIGMLRAHIAQPEAP